MGIFVGYDENIRPYEGTIPIDPTEYEIGQTVTVLGKGTLSADGKVFVGWNTEYDGSGDLYHENDTFEMYDRGGATFWLWAVWVDGYSVLYDINGGEGIGIPTDENLYLENDSVAVLGLESGAISKTGYRWDWQWNTAADGSGTTYDIDDTFEMPAEDVTLYVLWVPVYTVTYNGNGHTSGGVPSDSNFYAEGENATVLGNTEGLAKDYYRFGGWNTQADGLGDHYDPADTVTMPASDVTLYAEWIEQKYIIYHDDGAEYGTLPPEGVADVGTTAVVARNTGVLRKSGKLLFNWRTKPWNIRPEDGLVARWSMDAWSCAYEYPDDPAGVTYLQDAWATTDSWTAYNGTLAVASGGLITTQNASTFVNCYRTLSALDGLAVRARIRASKSMNIYVQVYNGSFRLIGPYAVTTDWTTINALNTYTGTDKKLYFQTSSTTSGDWFEIDWVYVGTGACLQPLADDTGNGMACTVFGGQSVAGLSCNGISRNGVNAYERTTNVLATVPDVWWYHESLPFGNSSTATQQCFVNYKAQSATLGFLYIFHGTSSDNLLLQYCNGSSQVNITFASYFTGYTSTRIDIDIVINWTTGAITVYRNGAYFGSGTMTTPVKPTAGSYMYFGSYQGTSYFHSGIVDERRMYNREPSAAEVADLYDNLIFPVEYDFDEVVTLNDDLDLYPEWDAALGEYQEVVTDATAAGVWTPSTAGTAAKNLSDAAEALRLALYGATGVEGPLSPDNVGSTYEFADSDARDAFLALWTDYQGAVAEMHKTITAAKNRNWSSLAAAQTYGVAGDTFVDSGLTYRATVAGSAITLANSTRLTPKRYYPDVANSTARAALTGMIYNDTVYQTDTKQWYIYQVSGGTPGWQLDGPAITADGTGASAIIPRFRGSLADDPSSDNRTGDWYYNTSTKKIRAYTSGAWGDASATIYSQAEIDARVAMAARYLGRYDHAHPSSYNPGDWWLVYHTNDDAPQRGIWYSNAGTPARITTSSSMELQAKMVDALADVAWAEANSKGTSTDYGIATFFQSLAAVTAWINALFAKVIILQTGGEIKSSNYSAGSAGFKIQATGDAEFNSILLRGKATLAEVVIGGMTAGNITIKEDSAEHFIAWGASWTKVSEKQICGSGTCRVAYQLHTSNASYTAYARIYINGSAVGTGASTNETSYQDYYEDIPVSSGDMVQLYLSTGGLNLNPYSKNFKIKISENPGILTYLGNP